MKKNNSLHYPLVMSLAIIILLVFFQGTLAENQCDPWLMLLLSNDESAETQEIGVEGGIITYRSGIILEFPAGAVNERTPITVKKVNCSKVNPVLSTAQFASHEKRCIGGFVAEPDDLQFNVPVKATIPVLPFGPGEFPVQIEVNYDSQNYLITQTDLVYNGNEGVIEISLNHFSGYWLAVFYNHIESVCSSCDTWDDPAFVPICESLDALQPNCCMLLPAQREKCAPQCRCCREELMVVKSKGFDFSHNDCQVLSDEVEVSFPKCPNSPTEKYSISETSADCPKDIEFEIKVEPASLNLPACHEETLRATISGKSKDGTVVFFSDSRFFPTWEISDKNSVLINQSGTITAIAKGSATAYAKVSENLNITPGESQITVTSDCGVSGVWHMSPTHQSEMCRTDMGEWWQADPFSSFNVRFIQPLGEDNEFLVAYRTDTEAPLTGTWRSDTGEFSLSTNTSDPVKCGFLFSNSDICGDAVDCQMEACQDTTEILGMTAPDQASLSADSSWYYSVTISYETGIESSRAESTWECRGTGTVSGSRL